MLLHRGDGHQPAVRVVEVSTGLFGLHLAGALHEDAGDDLETVRDAVLDFLQEDGFLAQQVVLELLAARASVTSAIARSTRMRSLSS